MAKYDYGGGCPCGLYRECQDGCMNNPGKPNVVYSPMCACGENISDQCRCKGQKNEKDTMVVEESNDFGFSIVDEEELKPVADDRATKLRDMIMPLLKNLKSNPDKDIIKWRGIDRVTKIDEFIKKMNSIVDNQ